MTQEVLIMHLPEVCCLDGVVGIKVTRDPIVAVVISMACYLHFILYVLTLTASEGGWLVLVEVELLRSILCYWQRSAVGCQQHWRHCFVHYQGRYQRRWRLVWLLH
jgi:hypothetical protein